MKCITYKVFFETISNDIRINILTLLQKKPLSVTQICKALDQEQSKISHNLKKLADCHLVDVQKRGKKRIYSLNLETMAPLLELVQKHVEKYCPSECKLRGK
ncbi:MAG: metalloregulator ArsR/SmtB family transcription factor [Candidatus Woesearchaeota archaeon]